MMGWAYCGEDSQGREIGYAIQGQCDHQGCSKRIYRGVSSACGQMHGTHDVRGGDSSIEWGDYNCEKYFCDSHLVIPCLEHEDGKELYAPTLCVACAKTLEVEYRENEEWRDQWPTKSAPLPVKGVISA